MKVFELFNQTNSDVIYSFLKKEKTVKHISKETFQKRLENLLVATNEKSDETFVLVFAPYLCQGNPKTDRDIFLVKAEDVNKYMKNGCSPKQTLLFTHRTDCKETSVSNIMNAEICPLSIETFQNYEICAEIFFELAVELEDIADYTTEQAFAFIEQIKQQFGIGKTRCPKTRVQTVDVDNAIEQNVIFSYPYYVSASAVN